ncbi:hypothetical protein KDH_47630 [Dictyobacter sp. S3.2.2.5]|uniref:Response regulatory domain-containing protein n=1 Tax=Dictyobacter halimunensis TaxID=3026934 RepID=A0ABQ6FUJ8_9CHLR|nr:hypothetical protein KDH_47630 [Dictyobacter sp. S3.2.2.5]
MIDEAQCVLKLFRELLEDEGYEAILLPCPIQKAQDVEVIKPDLIIIEFIFNCKNVGWSMLQMLKTHCPTSCIPVIVCTTDAIAVERQYLSLQGIPVVYKPFDIDDLIATVRQVFALSEVALPM